jgi:hypothetical protein
VKLNKIAHVPAMLGLSSAYAFVQHAKKYTQQKNHRLNAHGSSATITSNLSGVLK